MKNRKPFVITKTSEDQQIVFGWANVAIRKDGTVVEDLQDDIIEPEELEKAAYEYVLNFRDAGEKHDPGLRQKGKLVESVVFTKEKIAAMGLPENSVPVGWWVGYKIADRAAWEKIKSGEYRSFSVEGRGERVPVEVVGKSAGNRSERIAKTFSEVFAKFPQYYSGRLLKTAQPALTFSEKAGRIKTGSFAAMSFSEILRKFNPYHDSLGRFTTAGGAASFTYSPGKSKAHDRAIAREKERAKANTNKTLKVEFTPAKTTRDAEAFAHDKLGIETVRYGKLNVEVANGINQSLVEHFNQFPELKKQIQFVGSAQERSKLYVENKKKIWYEESLELYKKQGYDIETAERLTKRKLEVAESSGMFKPTRVSGRTLAQSSFGASSEKYGVQGISVNEKFGKSAKTIKAVIEKSIQMKWSPEGTGSVKALIDHELGHQIDNLIGARNNNTIQKLYNDIDAKGGATAMADSLSRYAHQRSGHNKNRYSEFIAEAWSEYRNNQTPRQTAKQVGQEIERLYNERGNKA